ncbi:MAG: 23S rRNA (uridine(2552)-2'-O)-methyltransferase RlmE [Methylococcales bacterium]|nr:23S rRNA (uridine(2552)-2'-O)-methyltransferase RlmE [Methylococcales bacterium]
MKRSKSSHDWLQEHFHDEYVKQAQALGYRSRAVFKLQEIQEKDRIISSDMTVLDLGAAPGGWSQYARKIVGKKHKVIALDILPMEPLEGVEFILGDFREESVLESLYLTLGDAPVNLVLSDMAPNITGSKGIDQPRAIYLGELALDTARTVLSVGGTFLVKMFQGDGFDAFHQDIRKSFSQVVIRKPKASRPRSNEVYILAKGFK